MVELVDAHHGQVFGLCYRMLRHRHDAEDVTQESFVRALRSLAKWDSTREFLPWLLAIAGNRCRTLLAERMRRPPTTSLIEQLSDDADELERRAAWPRKSKWRWPACAANIVRRSCCSISTPIELCPDQRHDAVPAGHGEDVGASARRELVAQLKIRGIVREPGECSAQSLKIG